MLRTNLRVWLSPSRLSSLGLVILAALVLVPAATALPFTNGDVFVSVSSGLVQEFTPGGTFVQTLDTTTGGFTTGSAFDQAGNFYVTDFSSGSVSKFDSSGNLVGTFGSGYPGSPESIVFNSAGDAFVGQPNSATIEEFDPAGNPITTFSVATGDGGTGGTDWIDLAADNCTMHYTDEGTSVKSFNVCTNTQDPDFATGLAGTAAFAHRILPSGGELVADNADVVRLDTSGNVVQTYTFPGETNLFALNLDPDGTSFWTADSATGDVLHVNIADGAVLGQFNPGTGAGTVFGLSVKGEITAANNPPITAGGVGAISGTANQPLSGNVATFSVPDSSVTADKYSATIDWGDGGSSTGSITGSAGSFQVAGTHTYSAPGSYTVTVTIADVNDASNNATVTDTALIAAGSPTGKPVIGSGPPIKTTTSSALLAASLKSDGLATTYYFQYGIESKYRLKPTKGIVYDQRTPDQVLGAGTAQTAVTANASPLVPNAVYHARLVATNSAGTTLGPDIAFKTKADRKSLPAPVLGKAVNASVISGLVFFKLPGGSPAKAFKGRNVHASIPNNLGYLPLTEPLQLPVGTKIDNEKGKLRLVTAGPTKSKTQKGTFAGALFSIAQKAGGADKALTTLSLLEGAFPGAPTYASCGARAHSSTVTAGIASLSSKVLQTLRSNAHGRFRTRGRYSASTVRGTNWGTRDRCDGTLTIVRRGTVAVSDFTLHKTVLVHAGHRYLAPAKRHR